MSEQEKEIQSPCVSICALDLDNVCVGCHRTGEEISQWWTMDNAEKERVLALAKEREQKSYV